MATTGALDQRINSRARWWVAVIAGVMALLAPLAILEARSTGYPEIRVVTSGATISAEIVDGDHRILIINAASEDTARSAAGKLRRPWEPQPATIISPAYENAASGLWEVLGSLQPDQIVVAGLPDAAQTWAAIESRSRDEEIDLRFVAGDAKIELESLTISILDAGESPAGGRAVVIRHGDANVVLALGEEAPDIDGQLLISSDVPEDGDHFDALITSQTNFKPQELPAVLVRPTDRVVVKFDGQRLRVSGGVFFQSIGSEIARPTSEIQFMWPQTGQRWTSGGRTA